MITKENLAEVLNLLEFRANDKKTIFKKTYQDNASISIEVDFDKGKIVYPQDLTLESQTTSNFSQNENFVVLECVNHLLDLGYQPSDLVLEKTWTLGHSKKSGRADITIFKENESKEKEVYCIIECKTVGKEYSNALKDLENNELGNQLFSYAAQARKVEYLALYASDLDTNKIKTYETIIKFKDDKNILDLSREDDTLLTFEGASEAKDFFRVWEETYNKKSYEGIIFNSKPYQIGIKPLLKRDLKPFNKADGINVKFQEILRHNNISDKENAFNKLLSLFLCKFVDEEIKKDDEELDFQYKSFSDDYFTLYERIFKLFIKGMDGFLKEEVYKTKDNFIANTISTYIGKNRKIMQKLLEEELLKATLFSSNAFSFKETHNERLFNQNGKILVEVIELLSPYKISYSSKEQFLGELFETFLNEGFKEDEGRYFTPVPITRFIWNALPFESFIDFTKPSFPKVLDFACGSGHFLTEGVSAIGDYCKKQGFKINDAELSKNFYGIDKDNRLSRTTQVAMLLNGANSAKIRSIDGLEYNKDFYGGNQKSFDILVSNPPYSIKDFKAHLSKSVLKGKNDCIPYEVLEYTSLSSKAIENVFVERLTHILKPNAIAAIILPSSILSNTDLATIKTREILLENFAIFSIVSLGSQTFGTTGTNTIILFLRRFDEPPKKTEILKDSIEAIIKGERLEDFEDLEIFEDYLHLQKLPNEIYTRFLKQDIKCLENEYFKAYFKDFVNTSEYKGFTSTKSFKAQNKDIQESQINAKFFDYALLQERKKLKFFILTFKQNTLIVNAPQDNSEQKKFLGYTISQAKNKQSGLSETSGLLSDKSNRNAEDKIAYAIKKAFGNEKVQNESFDKYLIYTKTCHLLSFDLSNFTKAIKLNVASENQSGVNPFENCKYELVRLGEIISELQTAKRPEGGVGNYTDGALSLGGEHINNTSGYIKLDSPKYVPMDFYKQFESQDKGIVKKNDILICKDGALSGKVALVRDEFLNQSVMINEHIFLVRCNESEVKQKYLFFILHSGVGQSLLKSSVTGSAQGGINQTNLKNLKIPLPPLEIQKQIVAECEKVEEQYNTIRMSIEEYQKLIKAILIKCGICELQNTEFANNELDSQNIDETISLICKELESLESKLDFGLLQNLNEETTSKESLTLDIQELQNILESLPTPPPRGWERVKLGEIADISRGASPRPISQFLTDKEGGVSWIKIGDVAQGLKYITQTKEKITQEGANKSKRVKMGDFILSNSMSVGRPYICKIDGCIHDGWLLLSNISQNIDKEFLYYALISDDTQKQIQQKALGSLVENLNIDRVKQVKIPFLPLKIQKQIISALESIESKITEIDSKLGNLEKQKALILANSLSHKRERERERERERDEDELKLILTQIALLEWQKEFWQKAFKQVLSKTLLTKPLEVKENPIQNLKNLLNTLPIPPKEGWERARLNDKTKFSLSIGKRVLDSELNPQGKIPVYSANVKKPFGFIDREILNTYDKDSVLWGIDGDWLVGFVPKNTPFYPTDHCGVLRVNEGKARLIAYSLECEGVQAGFSRNLRASIQRIATLKIIFPPLKAQEQIAQALENIESQIVRLDSILPSLQSQKQAILKEFLMQKKPKLKS